MSLFRSLQTFDHSKLKFSHKIKHLSLCPLSPKCGTLRHELTWSHYLMLHVIMKKGILTDAFLMFYSSPDVRRMMLVAPRVKRVPSSMMRRSLGLSSTLSTKVPVLLLLSFRVYFKAPRLSRLTVMVQ